MNENLFELGMKGSLLARNIAIKLQMKFKYIDETRNKDSNDRIQN